MFAKAVSICTNQTKNVGLEKRIPTYPLIIQSGLLAVITRIFIFHFKN